MSERLGHATVGITMDVYSHLLPGLQEEAVSRVEAALSEAIASHQAKASQKASGGIGHKTGTEAV